MVINVQCSLLNLSLVTQWCLNIEAYEERDRLSYYQRFLQLILLKRFAMKHQVLEHGYHTAVKNIADVWFITDGSCLPRDMNSLPEETKASIPEDRRWRQEK